LALALARDPARRAALRAHLLAARDTSPLFDAPAYARALESAYTTMANRARAGEQPAPFAVAAAP
jgi:predicted O-linked N-acetylglucosamine transferase (SPINDLY family)